MRESVFDVLPRKPKAVAYIDDRALLFDGNYDAVIQKLKNGFFPHWHTRYKNEQAQN